jgi:hypothetical protein
MASVLAHEEHEEENKNNESTDRQLVEKNIEIDTKLGDLINKGWILLEECCPMDGKINLL